MPDGTFRRPPQLWEQRIAGLVAVNSVGTLSGTGTSEVGSELTPGDGGPAPEPPTIAPTPTVFSTPSTPTVTGTVQGIRVTWDGNNSSGELYPPDAYVEIHVDTTSGTFTPSGSTLRGTLLRAGTFSVMGLAAGTTYFVRLVGKDGQGNATAASTAASSQTGLTTSSDYGTATINAGAVSFDARAIGGITTTVGTTAPTSPVTGDIWLDSTGGAIVHKRWSGSAWVTQAWGSSSISAGAVTATQIAAGAVTAGAIAAGSITTAKLDASAITADKIAAGTITGDKIAAGTIDASKISAAFITASDVNGNVTSISGSTITSGTITGRTVQSASSGKRIVIDAGVNEVQFWNTSGTKTADVYPATVSGNNGLGITGALDVTSLISGQSLNINGAAIDFPGATTGTTTADAGFNGDRLRKKTSSKRYKYDIAAADGDFLDVEDAKRSDVVTVSLADVLSIGVAEFSWLEEGEPSDKRDLGFIAEDVAQKFPLAVGRDPDGTPIAVRDTPILAALLAVVREQQQTIADLTARVTALEGA